MLQPQILILILLMTGIIFFSVQLLKYYRHSNKYLLGFWLRRHMDGNLTDVDRRPYAGYGTAVAGLLLVFFVRDVLHNVKLAGFILMGLLAYFVIRALWSIPSAIKQRIDWYRNLPTSDKQLYKRHIALLRNLYISGIILLAFMIFSLHYLSQ